MKINEMTGEVTHNGETVINSAGICLGSWSLPTMRRAINLRTEWSDRPKLPANWRRDAGCFCPVRCDGGPVAVYVNEEKPRQVEIFHRWVTEAELEQIPQVQKYAEWLNELKKKESEAK